MPPLTEPPTEVGSTVTVVEDELSIKQLPFLTTALKIVVDVSAADVYVSIVLVIGFQVEPPFVELTHPKILPV